MSKDLRHVGKLKSTGTKVIVVYMQIPGRESHALVVDADTLPPKYGDELLSLVQNDAQGDKVLADFLSRRVLAYSGIDALNTLHQAGALMPMPIEQIVMTPNSYTAIPLVEVIKAINPSYFDGKNVPSVENEITTTQPEKSTQPTFSAPTNEQEMIARNLLITAQMMEVDANKKREEAYALDPSLRPVQPTVAVNSVTEVHAAQVTKTRKPRRTKVEMEAARKATKPKRASVKKVQPETEEVANKQVKSF